MTGCDKNDDLSPYDFPDILTLLTGFAIFQDTFEWLKGLHGGVPPMAGLLTISIGTPARLAYDAESRRRSCGRNRIPTTVALIFGGVASTVWGQSSTSPIIWVTPIVIVPKMSELLSHWKN